MAAKPHIVILGAGPAGLGAAYKLARTQRTRVTVLERNHWVGGNAGSFDLAGLRVDYGSHRLHPACDAEILRDIRALLGDDLLDRPRHGRIRLRGRWIHFPLKPLDLLLRLPPAFSTGVTADFANKIWRGRVDSSEPETFATVLERGLGRTVCRDFYFPYVRKIWGLEPKELSVVLAQRRVSGSSLSKIMSKVLSAVPGFKKDGRGHFFYPRRGYGQISEAYYQAAKEAGAEILLGASIESVELGDDLHTVRYQEEGQTLSIEADHVWSTIPITVLARCLKPSPPPEMLRAAESLSYQGMILIYLLLEQERFSEYDAHYFPGPEIPISRLSEPKNYNDGEGPKNFTVLCAEYPCSPESLDWDKSNEELGRLMCDALSKAGIAVRAPIRKITTRRLRQAYPVYRQGYEVHFARLDKWLERVDGLLTFGRQGLFAHDNTHHALYMAYSAAACLGEDGGFDRERWQTCRRVFETHVVED